ncbi:FdhF/YdeP family oxidoreductase [Crateriforma conspicua]|uniref:Putative formate dehydrogenase n=1 Tax=Crateriforma conspicua TaxID=2527996 RepID=A0A5C6FYQ7_9PLAN|nr:FdhF/YdeP family oxidoreductase [Crateriforma conspicua]TWU67681.1 putative formate dehydrogenase [Crateriforma conspicua]
MVKVNSGGGWRAIAYSFKKGREAGGMWKFYRALRSKNACKTCALGMGGQKGGMVNEVGSFPEVCKKSMQAMASDMQGGIDPNFWKQNSIESLQRLTPRELEYLGRLVHPVRYRRGQSHFETITWEQAFDTIVGKLREVTPDETFWYFSGRSSNEAGFLLQLMARLYGTNNVNNCSYYCHQASGVGLNSSVGSGTATIQLEDLEHADCVMLIGGNPASNHPRLMSSLLKVRRSGGKVIVINPVRETGLIRFRIPSDPRSLLGGSKIATHYYQPHIGGDLALLWGIAKAVRQAGRVDLDFLSQHCRHHDEWLAAVDAMDWAEIVAKSGVSQAEMEEIAEVYGQCNRAVFAWTMGITHHQHGVLNVQAISALALCRGMVGRPGSGLMPIRGHSNVQGIGSVGVTPRLKKQIFDALQEKYGIQLPTSAGKDTLACMESAHQGDLKVGFCLGGNLYGSNPDSAYAAAALSNLQMNVMLSTTMNTGHVHGLADDTIILPVLARDEEPQPTTQESMFNYVRLSDGGPRRLPGPRSEIDVISTIASRLMPDTQGVDWTAMGQTSTIRQWIGEVIPGFEKIKSIDQSKEEFQIAGRTFHQPSFGTKDGKAILHVHALPPLAAEGPGRLRLMTVRSEGQFNTVVYEDEDLYRNQTARDIILIHPDDFPTLGIHPESRVTVSSDTGRMENILARPYPDIRSGNALMYYPESNVLVPRSIDPKSKTPAFKGVVITVTPQERGSVAPAG